MSASLVGSEMCIRDRSLQDAASGCSDEPQLVPHTLVVGRPEGQRQRASTCLLYTSDAADDM
eukprot:4981886-Alexandrium_andersonii.AAC.1